MNLFTENYTAYVQFTQVFDLTQVVQAPLFEIFLHNSW